MWKVIQSNINGLWLKIQFPKILERESELHQAYQVSQNKANKAGSEARAEF